MATEVDPFELFALVNPFTDLTEAGDTLTEADEQLLATIVATPLVPQPRQHPRRPWIIGGAVVVAVVATAAFAYIRRDHPDDPSGIVCYGVPSLSNDSKSVVDAGPDPTAQSAFLWSNGHFGSDGAPPLVACVSETGVAAVFPGDESLCSKLGLASFDPDASDEQRAVDELNRRIVETFENECFHQDEGLAEAQRLLDELGLDDWTVTLTEPFPPGHDCAGPGFDVATKALLIFGGRPDE